MIVAHCYHDRPTHKFEIKNILYKTLTIVILSSLRKSDKERGITFVRVKEDCAKFKNCYFIFLSATIFMYRRPHQDLRFVHDNMAFLFCLFVHDDDDFAKTWNHFMIVQTQSITRCYHVCRCIVHKYVSLQLHKREVFGCSKMTGRIPTILYLFWITSNTQNSSQTFWVVCEG